MEKVNRKTARRILNPAWLYLLTRPLKALSLKYGMNRGQPIDRYYIDEFLEENKKDIYGVCLEIRDNRYTGKYSDKITKADILDLDKSNTNTTIVGDLRSLNNITDNTYNCIILTQTLQYIDDIDSAIKECHRILKPDGVILATAPIMSRIDPHTGQKEEFWRFTEGGLNYLFQKSFKSENVSTKSYGNVSSGIGFWIGQSSEELSKEKLDHHDPLFSIIAMVHAKK